MNPKEPIGASMLNLLGRGDDISVGGGGGGNFSQSTTRQISTSVDGTSSTTGWSTSLDSGSGFFTKKKNKASLPSVLLEGLNMFGSHQQKNTSSSSILLHGPPRSGKTSLAMNLATSIAVADKCRCAMVGNSCCCISVTIFRPATSAAAAAAAAAATTTNAMGNQRRHHVPPVGGDFPFWCTRIQSRKEQQEEKYPIDENDTNYYDDNDNEHNNLHKKNHTNSNKDHGNVVDWDRTTLRRIQIKYVDSVRDMLYELLTITGKPLTRQPKHGIIIDNLEQIVRFSSDQFHSMTQVAAVALDTRQSLGRLHGTAPLLLTVSESNNISPWFDVVISTHPDHHHHHYNHHHHHHFPSHASHVQWNQLWEEFPRCTILSSWKLEVYKAPFPLDIDNDQSSGRRRSRYVSTKYVIAKTADDKLQIFYSPASTDSIP